MGLRVRSCAKSYHKNINDYKATGQDRVPWRLRYWSPALVVRQRGCRSAPGWGFSNLRNWFAVGLPYRTLSVWVCAPPPLSSEWFATGRAYNRKGLRRAGYSLRRPGSGLAPATQARLRVKCLANLGEVPVFPQRDPYCSGLGVPPGQARLPRRTRRPPRFCS